MSRKHKRTEAAALLHVQDYVEPPRKKRDSRDFYESRDGKPFCTYDREKGTGVARDARGRWCCESQIQRDGARVVAIHAGDVVIKFP